MDYSIYLDEDYDDLEESDDEIGDAEKVLSQMWDSKGLHKSVGFKKIAFNDEFFCRSDE